MPATIMVRYFLLLIRQLPRSIRHWDCWCKGFVIGTIENVERGPGAYHEIAVQPAVDFSRLEEVLVVTTPMPSAGSSGVEP